MKTASLDTRRAEGGESRDNSGPRAAQHGEGEGQSPRQCESVRGGFLILFHRGASTQWGAGVNVGAPSLTVCWHQRAPAVFRAPDLCVPHGPRLPWNSTF
ncbi:hypothetical protein NDU88_001786 [Pleurodeles waltl]|uniref:Uncharacterized protein n=1 Tax=Pleurodeles waltl TaxID=8319 RepID=A0AAV7P506_PLEWA|nr:hypothetical protein NDU88_001786 [Pleurodeles waltl]